MKTNGQHEVIARITRQGLVLAALLAMALSTALFSHAQLNAAQTESAARTRYDAAATETYSPASPSTVSPERNRPSTDCLSP